MVPGNLTYLEFDVYLVAALSFDEFEFAELVPSPIIFPDWLKPGVCISGLF